MQPPVVELRWFVEEGMPLANSQWCFIWTEFPQHHHTRSMRSHSAFSPQLCPETHSLIAFMRRLFNWYCATMTPASSKQAVRFRTGTPGNCRIAWTFICNLLGLWCSSALILINSIGASFFQFVSSQLVQSGPGHSTFVARSCLKTPAHKRPLRKEALRVTGATTFRCFRTSEFPSM